MILETACNRAAYRAGLFGHGGLLQAARLAAGPAFRNQLVQGPASPIYKIVDYREEGLAYSTNSVLVSNNDFRNSAPGGTGIYDPACVT
jgi:hypothetical protein